MLQFFSLRSETKKKEVLIQVGHLLWSFSFMHRLHLWLKYATPFVNTHHLPVILEVAAPLVWVSAYRIGGKLDVALTLQVRQTV